uniref:RCC1-like domain-containing protein n=1 Tax=Cebus imitator TaxID=2715852 RepID=A0A2K5SB59_CEBIM
MPPKCIAKRRSPPENAIPKNKKVNISHRSHSTEPGLVLTLGQGDVGQLGLGENVMERKKPALVSIAKDDVQAEAGGMHTECLSKSGQVYSFGCNDEDALGRDTSVEGSEMVPGKAELQEKVSAGDSHTAALTQDGRVFLWDNNSVIGLLEPMKKSIVPVQVQLDVPVVKEVSGNNYLMMLTADGDLYPLDCREQGPLGCVPELFCVMLKPRRSWGQERFQNAFCGTYFTFAISQEGHNLTSFKNSTKSWVGFSGGEHHTVCMDSEGKAYSLGRAEYGRLDLLERAEEKSTPTLISRLPAVSSVACGASVGYAVTKDGHVLPGDEDTWSPVEMTDKKLRDQHTVLLVKDEEQNWCSLRVPDFWPAQIPSQNREAATAADPSRPLSSPEHCVSSCLFPSAEQNHFPLFLPPLWNSPGTYRMKWEDAQEVFQKEHGSLRSYVVGCFSSLPHLP